jgi:hypothetical protein
VETTTNHVKSDISPGAIIYLIFAIFGLTSIGAYGMMHISAPSERRISKDADMATFLSAKDVASALDVDAKTFRRFVRSYVKKNGGTVGQDTPGRGGRYAFDEGEMDAIRDAFIAWRSTRSGLHVSFLAIDEDGAE